MTTSTRKVSLKVWLTQGRGRCGDLAAHLGVTPGRISQMANTDGVPARHMLAVRAFTKGAVSLESMLMDRKPDEPQAKRRKRPAPAPAAAA